MIYIQLRCLNLVISQEFDQNHCLFYAVVILRLVDQRNGTWNIAWDSQVTESEICVQIVHILGVTWRFSRIVFNGVLEGQVRVGGRLCSFSDNVDCLILCSGPRLLMQTWIFFGLITVRDFIGKAPRGVKDLPLPQCFGHPASKTVDAKLYYVGNS